MKKLLVWMLVAAGIMLVLPWLTVTFVKGDSPIVCLHFPAEESITTYATRNCSYGLHGRFFSHQLHFVHGACRAEGILYAHYYDQPAVWQRRTRAWRASGQSAWL